MLTRFQVNRFTAPCQDCGRREVGCHGKCEEYAQFHAAVVSDKQKQIEQSESAADKYAYEKSREVKNRSAKKKKNGSGYRMPRW